MFSVVHPQTNLLNKAFAASVALLFLFAGYAFAQTATIQAVRLTHNVTHNNRQCLLIEVDAKVDGARDHKIQFVTQFECPKGVAIMDNNGQYKSENGKACAYANATPPYDNARYTAFKYYIPNEEIHAPTGNQQTVYASTLIIDQTVQRIISSRYYVPFTFNKSITTSAQGSSATNTSDQCQYCHGTGKAENTISCLNCWGRGKFKRIKLIGTITQVYYETCPKCNGRAKWKEMGACKKCGGTGRRRTVAPGGYVPPLPGPDGKYIDTDKRPERRRCPSCSGNGKCSSCHGKGGEWRTVMGTESFIDCLSCSGRGTCAQCFGTGYVY